MKIRIQGNSLRLRLSETEVNQFRETGHVEEIIAFGERPEEKLVYALRETAEVSQIEVAYETGKITIQIPSPQALIWVNSNQNGLEKIIPNGTPKGLKILIEKDLDCFHRPEARD